MSHFDRKRLRAAVWKEKEMFNIIEIHDFSAPELDIYARWTENQLLNRKDPDNAMFIAESPKVIQTALDAGYEPISCLVEKKHVEGQAAPILARVRGYSGVYSCI